MQRIRVIAQNYHIHPGLYYKLYVHKHVISEFPVLCSTYRNTFHLIDP